MKKTAIVLAATITALSMMSCGGNGNMNKTKLEDVVDFVLEVEAGRDVKILQLTDIQIIDSDQQRFEGRLHDWSIEPWKPEHIGELAWKYTRQAVATVKPDLIVLSGDNVYGEFDDSGASLQKLVAEMESYGIPWTITFGNHDNETRKGMEWTCSQYSEAEHCMFKRGDTVVEDGVERFVAEGNGNFNIGIVQDGKLTEVVWLMDSNGHTDSNRDENMYSQAGILDNQLAWFRQRNERIKEYNNGENVKSIGFFHHPLRAFGDGMQKYGYQSYRHDFYDEYGDYGTFPTGGINIPENDNGDFGFLHADPGQYIDSNYKFHKMLIEFGCEGWFFGHDHVNNASVEYQGVRYTYGLKASEYDSFNKGEVGGTEILVGEGGLRVRHVYHDDAQD